RMHQTGASLAANQLVLNGRLRGNDLRPRQHWANASISPGLHTRDDIAYPRRLGEDRTDDCPCLLSCSMRTSTFTLVTLLIAAPAIRADEPVNNEFFEKKVRPILVANCVSCHGPQKQKSELRLDSKSGFAKGGQNGALVKPGDPDKSRLIQVIRYDGDIK